MINTVVIVEHSREMINNYMRMLEACKAEFECNYFQYPEEAVAYIQREGAAVLVCELDMPIMSGKEVFDIVEMISPSTVKIAMTEVTDIRKTLDIVNQSRIFKLILKPFFLPEDITEPIRAALNYYRLKGNRDLPQKPLLGMDLQNENTQKLVGQVERAKQTGHNICKTLTGIIRGSLQNSGMELLEEEKSGIIGISERMFQEFVRYYMFGAQNYIFHLNYLLNLLHAPKEKRIFQIKNENNQEIPNEIFRKMAYTMVTTGYIFKEIFGQYQAQVVIEQKKEGYLLQLMMRIPENEEEEKRVSKKVIGIMMQMAEKIFTIFAERTVQEMTENILAVEIYYREGEKTYE